MAWAGRVAMAKGHQGCCVWAGRWLVECPCSNFCREKVLGFGPRVTAGAARGHTKDFHMMLAGIR